MEFIFDDGGRREAGYIGFAGDCACRSIAIVTRTPYQKVYDDLNSKCSTLKPVRGRRGATRKSSSREGVPRKVYQKYLEEYGWKWVPTMKIGQGTTVHLRKDELPAGRVIARVSRHLVAVIDGVIHDTHDCSRGGYRCVYGYFIKS